MALVLTDLAHRFAAVQHKKSYYWLKYCIFKGNYTLRRLACLTVPGFSITPIITRLIIGFNLDDMMAGDRINRVRRPQTGKLAGRRQVARWSSFRFVRFKKRILVLRRQSLAANRCGYSLIKKEAAHGLSIDRHSVHPAGA